MYTYISALDFNTVGVLDIFKPNYWPVGYGQSVLIST